MIFDYKRNPAAVTVYGKEYEIPTKTAFFVNEVNRLHKEIAGAEDSVKSSALTLEGIGLFLGDEFVDEHFGGDIQDVDTDEIGALWIFLNKASSRATAEVIKKYAPVKLSD